MEKKKSGFKMPSAYSILLLLTVLLAGATFLIPAVTNATLQDVVMAPIKGFSEAKDISLFILMIGGFLGVVTKTGALDTGIAVIVKKMKGKELLLIPVLMFIFSLGGTSYGMAEETVAFYALIVGTMVAAKMDALVGASVVLLGAGSGVLGSTVNPFLVSAAVDALKGSFPDMVINQGTIILLGTVLWLSSLTICIFFVLGYAKKVKADKEKSLLSAEEQSAVHETYGKSELKNDAKLSTPMIVTLVLFTLSFVVMIISLIPWESFGITTFVDSTAWLTGTPWGSWYFPELQAWFLICAIIIGVVAGIKEKELVKTFIAGAADMVGVALIVAVSRGLSVLMSQTGLDKFVLESASSALQGVSSVLFAGFAYIIYIALSFLIPSTSGLAAASMPTFGGLANSLSLSPEVMIMIFSAASGLVNLFTPTSGVVMGGLAIAKIEYSTWLKFVGKIIATIFLVNLVIVCGAIMLF